MILARSYFQTRHRRCGSSQHMRDLPGTALLDHSLVQQGAPGISCYCTSGETFLLSLCLLLRVASYVILKSNGDQESCLHLSLCCHAIMCYGKTKLSQQKVQSLHCIITSLQKRYTSVAKRGWELLSQEPTQIPKFSFSIKNKFGKSKQFSPPQRQTSWT